MSSIYNMIPELVTMNSSIAIATVIDTSGSTPQKHGSTALFNESGLIAGTVGGGVLEGKVQEISHTAITTGKSGLYHFLLNKEISYRQDAICGGEATILVDVSSNINIEAFIRARESLIRRIPGVLITIITGHHETHKKISRFWITSSGISDLPDIFTKALSSDLDSLLSAGRTVTFRKHSMQIKNEHVLILMEPLFPPSQLIIAGAGHIGRALSSLGKLLDFEVTVIDDRAEFANRDNIPSADHIIVDDPGAAMNTVNKGKDTFIVIVTRGHDDDAKALRPCIDSGAGYVGMIGSKTKIAKMHLNFIQNGWATEEQWSAIHAPIGLDIKSKTVEEIAISIAAELILIRNSR